MLSTCRIRKSEYVQDGPLLRDILSLSVPFPSISSSAPPPGYSLDTHQNLVNVANEGLVQDPLLENVIFLRGEVDPRYSCLDVPGS